VRHRFLVCAITVARPGRRAWIFYPSILDFLSEPYCRAAPHHCTFLVTNPLDGLTLRFKISVYGGVLRLAGHLLAGLAIHHARLKASERKYAIPFVRPRSSSSSPG
jgi:Sec-independent protein secretion pathway component TatC